ncbi:CxxH/CxxC protein [Kroppenstedtia eburnea]|uniref:CxxH/CxxC protein, BA_5709 family n=1 Tax=Kroppenstedtia eburnea TaxID=714067 RepID=A0A1N7JI87_9BACL|nr:CxxH/CxxC protein [Kroppenstedtia eburnea]QKI83581.1 CxxH/CxxC protein [Kroppenstedtia eburnea]SIS49045.1 CxxH/CxxC protein, BA_5709 family [Kroppenstedtia eburnea]
MQENLIWYACAEHIDPILDEIVDEQGRAPDLLPLTAKERTGEADCHWCGKEPDYLLILDGGEK